MPAITERTLRARRLLVAVAAGAAVVTTVAAPSTGDRLAGSDAESGQVELVASATKAAPSGKKMPRSNVKGWRQIFKDDFTGSKLKKPWTKYSGVPGGGLGGYWKPSHAVVSGGALHLKTYKENGRWVSAGVGSWNGLSMKYGRIDVRFRAKKAKGVAYTLLLWPAHGGWPPEIDFAEDGGGNRKATTATLHYGSSNKQVQRSRKANFAKWHTVGVRWSPGKIIYTLDGTTWATVKNKGVPATTMVLAMQTQTAKCGLPWYACPGASTPKRSSVDIDWVVAYKKA